MSGVDPELLSEEELREAFAPLAADPEAFEEGVRERIAAGSDEVGSAEPMQSGALRIAAGLLPPGLLPLAGAGGSLVAKKFTLKALPAFVAWPVVALGMVLVTFAVGVRRVRSMQADPDARGDDAAAQQVTLEWWRRNRIPAIVLAALVGVLIFTRHRELVLLLLAVSMLGLTSLVRQLADAGLGVRRVVGKTCGALLMQVSWLTYFAVSRPETSNEIIPGIAGWFVLLAGAGLCFRLSMSGAPKDSATGRDIQGIRVVFGVLILPAVVAIGVLLAVRYTSDDGPKSYERSVRVELADVAARGLDEEQTWPAWETYRRVAAATGTAFEPERAAQLSAWLDDRIERYGSGLPSVRIDLPTDRLSPRIMLAALRMNLVAPERVEELAEQGAARELDRDDGPIKHLGVLAARITAMARGNIDPPTRTALAARLEASIPGAGSAVGVFDALLAFELLDELGVEASESARARARSIVALALDTAELPEVRVRQTRDLAVKPLNRVLHALELARIVGVPDGVDAGRLRGALEYDALGYPGGETLDIEVKAELARRIAAELWPDVEPVHPPEQSEVDAESSPWFLRNGTFVASLLLALLAVVTTWRAPIGDVRW